LGLAALVFLGMYYLAIAVLSLLGIAFISYANRWAEYFFSGLFLLSFIGVLIGIFTNKTLRACARRLITNMKL